MIAKFCISALLASGIAAAQLPPAKPAPSKTGTPAFEVVSIRPSKPGAPIIPPQILPDGFRFHDYGLWLSISWAFFPNGDLYSADRLQGEPSWVHNQMYDVEARVAPVDIPAWQSQGPEKKMLQAMLQQMLADRCKLVFHRTPAQIEGYALLVGKNGPKLKQTPPGETFPPTYIHLHDGGEAVSSTAGEKLQLTFYGTTMASFAAHLSGQSFNHPVLDQTHLSGKYDFVLARQSLDPNDKEVIVTPSDANPLANWNVKALGLELKQIKIPTETIVIDHIEKPSEN